MTDHSTDQQLKGTNKDKFDCLYETLVTCEPRMVNEGVTAASILLVAAGWLLTSKDATRAIQNTFWGWGQAVTIVMCVATAVIYTLAINRHLTRAKRMLSELGQLGFVEPRFYDQHQINRRLYWFTLGVNYWHILMIVLLVLFR